MRTDHDYYVYIMASVTGTLYIGMTNDIVRRVSEHQLAETDGFTKMYQCNKLVYYENFSDPTQAIAREKYLKGKKRDFKENLIVSVNPGWKDLSKEWT